MSGGRHGQWPPVPHNQGGAGSTGSSPSNSNQGPSANSYHDPSYPNGAYRTMMNSRYGSSGSAAAGGAGYSHVQQHGGGPNLSPRMMQSSSHLAGPYAGTGPSSQQQVGGAMQHVAPSVFGDPRAGNQNGGPPPGSFYGGGGGGGGGGYGQPQGMPSSSFPHATSSYSYTSPADANNHNMNQSHAQHMQTAPHHHPYGAAPPAPSGWMSSPPAGASLQGHEMGPYSSSTKQGPSSHYGHAMQAQSYKPSDGYGQPPIAPLEAGVGMGSVYSNHLYNRDAPSNEVKADPEDDEIDGEEVAEDGDGSGVGVGKKGKNQAQKGTSEFVKKLFRMLDDTSYASIVSWGPTRDSFIVKDMNDFTKHVLPRHFRHSNFASFVRQLNKYDFHKVKTPGEQGQPQHLGVDQLWEFRHPAFIQGREDMLENVKRKVPTGKKIGKREGEDSPRDQSPSMPGAADAADKGAEEYSKLKDQVATLTASQDQMTSHINNLTKQYQGVIGEMLTFQKNMVQQDQLMQNLIQYLMNLEADRKIEASPSQHHSTRGSEASNRPQLENNDAFVSSRDAERLVTNFSDVAKESFGQMSEISHRAATRSGDGLSHYGSTASNSTSVTAAGLAYGESRTSMTSNQAPLSPKSVASLDTPGESTYSSEKGKSKSLLLEGQVPSVFFHPPHLDMNQESNPSSPMEGEHKDLFNAAANAVNNPSLAGFEGAGLRVFTVGTLQPRTSADSTGLEPDGSTPATAALEKAFLRSSTSSSENEENKPYGISVPNLENLPIGMPKVDGRSTSMQNTPRTSSAPLDDDGRQEGSISPSDGGSNLLRVRRSTYVPGWAVPPKVLVVDDDDVCRKLGSKFLQVFGCAIDVAVDGVTAVNKMNLEKYDLVLMDIVMPNLDGVSATSLIREFDPRTPIISMTSNSAPNELLSYMSSGMNDVLPKPFTKDGLLNMLEKHLIHLKTVQKMDEIPKALGLPPISDDMMQNVLSATAASAASIGSSSTSLSQGEVNPMAAMMGNGPQAFRASQDVEAGGSSSHFGMGGEEEEGIVNPLAGMGFSDEEYISMLQNLIAAGAVSDSTRGENADNVASVMGVTRGEGTLAGSGHRSKESTPLARSGLKRPAGSDAANDAPEEKRSRFTELQV